MKQRSQLLWYCIAAIVSSFVIGIATAFTSPSDNNGFFSLSEYQRSRAIETSNCLDGKYDSVYVDI